VIQALAKRGVYHCDIAHELDAELIEPARFELGPMAPATIAPQRRVRREGVVVMDPARDLLDCTSTPA
jgi:hypothetical protein